MFFDSRYIFEPPLKYARFGISDAPEGAYTTTDGDESKWGAVVENVCSREIQFMPVDHNLIFKGPSGNTISTCDGMLYTKDYRYLIFVEVKDVRKLWTSEPKNQLASTIELFRSENPTDSFQLHLAYATNRRHPSFQYSRKQEMQEFYNIYKFRLIYMHNILLK